MKDTDTPDEDDTITELSSLIHPPSHMLADPQRHSPSTASNLTETESLAMVSSISDETIAVDVANETESTKVAELDIIVTQAAEPPAVSKLTSETNGIGTDNSTDKNEKSPDMQETDKNIADLGGVDLGGAVEANQLPVLSGLEVAEDTVSRISSIQGDMCRICHCIAEEFETLISPCDCRGSMKWVHQKCLQRWVKSRDAKKCELCGYSFNMTSSVKPFRKWKKLNMSSVERRRVLCSVTFHVVAITCVIWSLYVLIDRTTQEIQNGDLNWPFWTKLVVVAIGFTGGLVFMYVQCKTYVKLFRRWKQFNRVIYINDITLPDEKTVSIDMTTSGTQEGAVNVVMEGHSERAATE